MRNNWMFFMGPDGGSSYILPMDTFLPHGISSQLFSHLHIPGSLALEAFSCVSKFAGALLCWISHANLRREIASSQWDSASKSCNSSTQAKRFTFRQPDFNGFHFNMGSKDIHGVFGKISRSSIQHLFNESERLHSFSVLSLAAALVPPFNNMSSNVLALPLENTDVQIHENIEQSPCQVVREDYNGLSFHDFDRARQAVEPRTGIEFPMLLDKNTYGLTSEVLVGTGSRTMKIIRIKSLKVYAFGFYIHPSSVCKKLGPKYASFPPCKLDKYDDFYRDLLREDIGMSVRLVVNCNGLKINTVRDAFEKSLRARLVKTNPNTDFHCLRAFGSFFTKDIPIPAGTIIDFRRTADGQFITEIGGNQIGAVRSKDLCRAFFDMYIGDFPVSEQTKEDIGRNVAGIIRRC
ncbi:PREDICTED: fatty-acid-binding protein 2 isoform X1 [Tarenaya hassleriana]|uniref:fatty-acid-binding protein 2 isoform X1 n=1 Tax=Tarenaya hassleriana TaxID=28532 RepID=UPI00053C4C97|nr:PREDICTED: fatty-acid-binding protein 2 isoform X1 [Tarenaya hassleriana]XP_019056945.1 PREDICTED: fatty-acid-binding protein 2 isoform X1 [Tarenaya hassleriana]